jgi:hypothetical protein
MQTETGAEMGSNEAGLRVAVLPDAPVLRRRPSPLARGVGYRLAWAAGLSAALWLAVFWALS